jgi:hypothetical protein
MIFSILQCIGSIIPGLSSKHTMQDHLGYGWLGTSSDWVTVPSEAEHLVCKHQIFVQLSLWPQSNDIASWGMLWYKTSTTQRITSKYITVTYKQGNTLVLPFSPSTIKYLWKLM